VALDFLMAVMDFCLSPRGHIYFRLFKGIHPIFYHRTKFSILKPKVIFFFPSQVEKQKRKGKQQIQLTIEQSIILASITKTGLTTRKLLEIVICTFKVPKINKNKGKLHLTLLNFRHFCNLSPPPSSKILNLVSPTFNYLQFHPSVRIFY
jgi:hypothetical protein